MGFSNSDFQVALLFQNIENVKLFSKFFRDQGIIPFFYEDLKSFWQGIQDTKPALALVDIRLMNDGELALKDHERIKSRETDLMFFVPTTAKPLVLSTFGYFHFGLIEEGSFVKEYFDNSLKRFFEFNHLKNIQKENEKELRAQERQIEGFLKNKQMTEEKFSYRHYISALTKDADALKNKVDFFKAIEGYFESIHEIDEFAFLELSFNGQKLISPLSSSSKFRMIPNLWLGSQSQNGIELFAQNMASQVVAENMGGEVVSLLIRGMGENPDKLIFIKSRVEAFFNEFDWTLFEEYLNSIYAFYLLKNHKSKSVDSKFIAPFTALQSADQNVFGGKNEFHEKEIVLLDMSSLFEVFKKRKSTRFYFEKFFEDFILRLETQTRIDFHLSEMSAKEWMFFVAKDKFEIFFKDLREYAFKFQYWKYFEDADQFLTMEIKPIVRQLPMSALAMIRAIEEKEISPQAKVENENKARQKTLELIWGRDQV